MVVCNHEEDSGVCLLIAKNVSDRTKVISQMKTTCGLYSCEEYPLVGSFEAEIPDEDHSML